MEEFTAEDIIQYLHLEIVRLEESVRLDDPRYAALTSVDITASIDITRRQLIFNMQKRLAALFNHMEVVEFHYPATWWDRLKEGNRFARLLDPRPVRYKTFQREVRVYAAACPHLQSEPTQTHLEFFVSKLSSSEEL